MNKKRVISGYKGNDYLTQNKSTLNKLSEKIGSPPASNLDPPVFRSSARMELLSLSAIYATFKSSNVH